MPDPASIPIGPDGFPLSSISGPAAAPTPAAPAPAAAVQAVAPPVIRDLTGKSLTKTYDLLWPKEIDGVEVRQVTMRRLSTGEVADFVEKVRLADGASRERFPIFFDAAGTLLSDRVWDALDPDDTDALARDAEAFLPARFRLTTTDPTGSTPSGSGTTDSSSGTSPASP